MKLCYRQHGKQQQLSRDLCITLTTHYVVVGPLIFLFFRCELQGVNECQTEDEEEEEEI